MAAFDEATAVALLAKLGVVWDGSSLSWQPTESWQRAVVARFGSEVTVLNADPRILRNLKKHINLERCKRMVRYCNEVGIGTHATYIFGLPGVRLMMADFEIESTIGCGTTVTMTKWKM